jgi:hypothetical protein
VTYLSGDALASSRRFVVSWLVEPAADAMNEVGEPLSEEDSLRQLREGVGLLERIGWPGTPLRPVAVNAGDLANVRRAAFGELWYAVQSLGEAVEQVRDEHRPWGSDGALATLDRVRALLDQIGWDEGRPMPTGAAGAGDEERGRCRRAGRRGGWSTAAWETEA